MSDIWNRIVALSEEKRARFIQQLQQYRAATDMLSVSDYFDHYDVAIPGGGMAGLTLVYQRKKLRPATRVVVIERQSHPVPEAAYMVGESTAEIAARYLRDILGLENHLLEQQLRKFGLRLFFTTIGSIVSPPLCTYQRDRGRLENTLGNRASLFSPGVRHTRPICARSKRFIVSLLQSASDQQLSAQ